MLKFHCCFVADDNRVTEFELLKVSTPGEAMHRAREMLKARPRVAAAEIWQSGKLVSRVAGPEDASWT